MNIDPSSGYRFSDICGAVESILSGKKVSNSLADAFIKGHRRYRHVVLFLIDGFGWSYFKKNSARIPFLKKEIAKGARRTIVSCITVQFPSTTSAQLTSLHTGLSAGEHGIFEWFYYEKFVDALISPIIFSFAGDKRRNTLQEAGVKPQEIFPRATFYRRLGRKGIRSAVVIPREVIPSPYLEVVTHGAAVSVYKTPAEGLIELRNSLRKARGKSYHVFYFDKIDSLAHQYGPASEHVQAEAELFFAAVEKHFFRTVKTRLNDTLFLFTADHGQVEVDPRKTIYLNKILPNLEAKFKKTKQGKPIVPGGSCRNMFLYVQDKYVEEVRKLLLARLHGKAQIVKTADLLKQGLFGASVDIELLFSRVGNLIILPHEGELVWWNKDKKFTVTHRGHHGGLSAQEMFVPLICIER